MYYEKFEKLPDGTVVRRCEEQTELAEWVQVGPRTWVRRVRRWDMKERRS